MLTTFIVMRHLPNVPTGAIAIQVEKFIDVRTVYSDTHTNILENGGVNR